MNNLQHPTQHTITQRTGPEHPWDIDIDHASCQRVITARKRTMVSGAMNSPLLEATSGEEEAVGIHEE
jgi:hypothetical protein